MCDCANCGASNTPSDMWPSDAGLICQECWEFQCSQAWWETVYPALQSPRRVPPPTDPYAPRPLWTRAFIALRRGLRRRRILDNLAWYRQARPRQRPLFFGASDCRGTLVASSVRPMDPGEQDTIDAYDYRMASHCACYATGIEHSECVEACRCLSLLNRPVEQFRRHTSRWWRPWQRPMFYSTTHRRVRSSRYNGRTMLPRPHTRFRVRTGTLHYLATRRYAAQQCRKLGFRRIKPGVWFDQEAGRVYLQADTIEPCEHIQAA